MGEKSSMDLKETRLVLFRAHPFNLFVCTLMDMLMILSTTTALVILWYLNTLGFKRIVNTYATLLEQLMPYWNNNQKKTYAIDNICHHPNREIY